MRILPAKWEGTPLLTRLFVFMNGSVNGIALCFCLCPAGVSRPVSYAPPELSRMLEVLSPGASRLLGGCY